MNPEAKSRLDQRVDEAEGIAREFGLDFYHTHFEVVPSSIMYEFGSYGLPGRFSHWTHGAAYHRMKTMYDYGLQRIYELVINTDPAEAFLLDGNSLLQNTLVAAHVLAHVDFFKNNISFQKTNRQMIDTAVLHADRKREYEFTYGEDEVEEFMDAVLSIEHNIDPIDFQRPTIEEYRALSNKRFREKQDTKPQTTPYDDLWNIGQKREELDKKVAVPFPSEPERDLLYLIANCSPKPLEEWQKDLIMSVRSEVQYFIPQMKTKIMNEGWATLWHPRILRQMTDEGILDLGEAIEWPIMHSAVASPHKGDINPYFLGWKIFENIERLGKGLPHPEGKKEKNWLGEELDPKHFMKDEYDIFWVRENIGSDLEFIRNYLTENLIEDENIYIWGADKEDKGKYVILEDDPARVKEIILYQYNNFGMPLIEVAEGGANYQNRSELYLQHVWDGRGLDPMYTEKTLEAIYYLWGRAVHLETGQKNKGVLITCDDNKISEGALISQS